MSPQPSNRLTHDQHVFLLALLAGTPALVAVMAFVWFGDYSARAQWTLTLVVVGAWWGFAAAARNRVVRTLQTMANLLSALREGDFSIRGRGAARRDPLGDVMAEINTLGNTLQSQRLGALEATALLRTVMDEIDVAIFAFDSGGQLRLANPAASRLLALPVERLLGRSAAELGLAELLQGADSRVLDSVRFAGAGPLSRWGLRRSSFREGGLPHQLIVIADVSQALRDEELKAWQRLVRVLGHELNNSLAPIKSIAGSLRAMMQRTPRPADWEGDLQSGLEIVESRAEGLTRFMGAYARLTRLPPPALAPVFVPALVRRVVSLEVRQLIAIDEGPELTARMDAAQIEQVLINLVMNAVDATQESSSGSNGTGVRVTWRRSPGGYLDIQVIDHGPGIANPSNLFVPFFTTKEKGSGIGLVLCRQIAENHGGSVTLQNRTDGRSGCVARLRLPL